MIQYVSLLLKDAQVEKAVGALGKYGPPATSSLFDGYLKIAKEILKNGSASSVSSLRDMLFKLLYGTGFTVNASLKDSFWKPFFIAHLYTLRENCNKKPELVEFSAKTAISLLRYVKDIPADKAFFDAGQASKVNH